VYVRIELIHISQYEFFFFINGKQKRQKTNKTHKNEKLFLFRHSGWCHERFKCNPYLNKMYYNLKSLWKK